jgi:hypothetical protein
MNDTGTDDKTDGKMHDNAEVTLAEAPTAADPATLAFEALCEEVALVRRAVAGLAAERAAIENPDYSETLGQIMRSSAAMAASLKALADMPALRLTARDWGREIAAAGEQVRREDRQALADAKDAFRQAAHDLAAKLSSARLADSQHRWLLWTGVGGIVFGMVLWAFGAGPIARAMPESWNWPEKMAAHIIGTDQETAGARLIETAAPDQWRDIVLGYRIVNDNRDAITRCEKLAAKETKSVRCTIQIDTVAFE